MLCNVVDSSNAKASGFKSVHVVSVSRLKVPVVATQTFIKSGLRFLKKVVAT